jgi:threonine/homoserine/homoserine lactone efflux protein
MGPVGVLCVQRSLNKGRNSGIMTGLGAMISDMLFALIAGLGVGFISKFIQDNQHLLTLIGGIVLLVMGVYIFKSDPTFKLHKAREGDSTHWHDLWSSFLLNISNVVGIFLFFMATFARFNIVDTENIPLTVAAFSAIAVGIVIWWFFISSLVDRLRDRFNLRALKVFNKILGVILFVIGLVGIITAINEFYSSGTL